MDLFEQYGMDTDNESAVINPLLGDGSTGALIVDTTSSRSDTAFFSE